MPSTAPDFSRLQSGPRPLLVRVAAIFVGIVWVTVLFWGAFRTTPEATPDPSVPTIPPVVVEPVQSYDSEDLERLADELALLRETRLTPTEQSVVAEAADIVGSIASGEAVVAASPTTSTSPSTAPATTHPPTTLAPTTTSAPPPPTTSRPRRTQDQMVADLADQLGVDLPDVDVAGG